MMEMIELTVKDAVLQALEQARGTRLSGGWLAEQLGVSRAAVHKAIAALRESGLAIDAVTGEGYRLASDDDSLTAAGINALLDTAVIGREILVEPSLTSSNTTMKEQYLGRRHGFTLFAEEQTGGRGRLGRTFVSPADTGVYMTILLHPTLPLSHLSFVTISAAIAVVRAIEQTVGFTPQIKWVNDVLMNGRKLCGILTEATIEGETGTVSSLVVGIGINLHPNPAWPEEVQAVAGALNHFEDVYALLDQGKEPELLEQYRERLCCIGRPVTVISPAGRYEAECVGLDEEAHLLVKTADGQVNALSSGEISIRL